MPEGRLMAEGKAAHAVIKALAEAGQDNWCDGRSPWEAGVVAEDMWAMTKRMDALKTS